MTLGMNTALQLASRTAGWLVNPPGGVSDQELREAVKGKIVLVTGASYGLGEATARKLARAGATVLLVARTADRLEELAMQIERAGGSAHAFPADLADPGAIDELGPRLLDVHGYVDIVISNAGKSIRRSIDLSLDRPQDFQRTIDINYLGPVRLLLALLPTMRTRRSGHIINVSTIGARIPPGPRWAAYQASKSAFDVFFRSAATELRTHGIAATSVYMGLIHTRMSAPTPIFRYLPGQTPAEAAEVIARAIVKRPREVAPWWARGAEISTSFTRTPWELAAGLVYRLSEDSDAARRSEEIAAEQRFTREEARR